MANSRLEQIVMTLCLLLSIGFALALLGWLAFMSPWDSFAEQGHWLMNNVWGQISLIDLYGGFFIALTLVWVLEPKRLVCWLLTLTLPFIGNPLLAIWLVWRWPHLKALASKQLFD